MHSAVELRAGHDLTDVPAIVRGAVKLGLLESVLVLVISLVSRFLPNGVLQTAVLGVIVVAGLFAVTFLPGLWTRPRTIEGIAGAAGIGLSAAIVYLLIDVTLLQNIGTYGHRWLELGGGSNWWYHPIWWMVGTFLPWFGAWMLANQLVKGSAVSPGRGVRSGAWLRRRLRRRRDGSCTFPVPPGTSAPSASPSCLGSPWPP